MNDIITSGYYKTSNGTILKVLYEAKHTETGEDLVVFQATENKDAIWVTPKKLFLRDGVKKIDDNYHFIPEALSSIPPLFPDINYTNEIPRLVDGNTFSKSVKAMITLLTNKGIVTKDLFDELETDDDIELLILKKIKVYSLQDDVEDIFHLIQIWGGITGRGIYIFNEKFDWGKIAPHYKKLIARCLSIKDTSDKSIDKLIDTITEFNTAVKHMGVSFITKHVRFWLYNTIGEQTLPIYDSIMAKCVMRQSCAQTKHLSKYWQAMIAKSAQLNISLMALERQIFKHIYYRE